MTNQQISYRIEDRLYLSITDRCTLACKFCPKTQGSLIVHDYNLAMDHRPEVAEIVAAIDDPTAYSEVVFCGYGEPTLRLKTLLAVAHHIKLQGGRVRVNTDGLALLIYNDTVLPALAECVDALSVSLNAHNEGLYEHHCCPNLPGSYQAMLDFLAQASRIIPNVTATAIAGLPGVDIQACERLALSLGAKFRRRELDVVG